MIVKNIFQYLPIYKYHEKVNNYKQYILSKNDNMYVYASTQAKN